MTCHACHSAWRSVMTEHNVYTHWLATQNIGDTGQASAPGVSGGRSLPVSVRPVLASEGCPWLRAERERQGWAQSPDSGPASPGAEDESSLAPANTGGGLVTQLMTRYPTWNRRGSRQLIKLVTTPGFFVLWWHGCLVGFVKLHAIAVLRHCNNQVVHGSLIQNQFGGKIKQYLVHWSERVKTLKQQICNVQKNFMTKDIRQCFYLFSIICPERGYGTSNSLTARVLEMLDINEAPADCWSHSSFSGFRFWRMLLTL